MLNTNLILYNPLKHHLSHLKSVINKAGDIETLIPIIKTFGNSKMDMYNGKISISELFQQIIKLIPAKDENDFKEWISKAGDFQKIKVSDNSEWVLRYAPESQFIHIHPGRYTVNTLRINAGVLKTAIITIAAVQNQQFVKIDAESVNNLRVQYLSLSPIANLEKSDQLNIILNFLMDY